MIRKILPCFILLLNITYTAFTQDQDAVSVKGKSYSGYIFDSAHVIFKSIDEEESRFTPSKAEVDEAERVLSKLIATVNNRKVNQTDGCPVIHKKIKKYYRQYVGFINKQGQKIIWINFFWNNDLTDKASKEIIQVNDGCSYYWNVEANITNSQLSNLRINGKG